MDTPEQNTGSKGGGLRQQLARKASMLHLYQKACIFLVAFLVFANGISNDYNIDDIYYTTEFNTVAAMGVRAIPTIFTKPTLRDNTGNTFDYRPVPMLSFALQHQLLGGSAVTGHFINVLLYAIFCLLLFVSLCRLMGGTQQWLAFFAVLIYAVHPLHTEVVDSIKSRDELLASFFGLLMIISLWKWHNASRWWQLLLAVVFFVLGLLCKATVVLYLGLAPVVLYFFSDISWRRILACVILLFMCGVVLKLGIKFMLPEPRRVFAFFENPFYTDHGVPLVVRTATASYVLGRYALLHVLPYPLSFYYGYRYIQLFYWSVLPILSLVLHLVLFWIAVRGIRTKSILAFGTSAYLVGIALFSNLIQSSPGIMAERFTFTSSIGFCVLLVAFLYRIFKVSPGDTFKSNRGKYVSALVGLIFLSYAGMSMVRNRQWRDTWTLYSHDVKHLKSSVKVNMLYAEQVMFRMNTIRYMIGVTSGKEQKVYRDSLAYFQIEERDAYLRAIEVAPDFYEALENVGVSYINMDSFETGKDYLLRARAAEPGKASIHSNLAIAYERMSARDERYLDSATMSFEASLRLSSQNVDAYSGLAMICLRREDTAAALGWSLKGVENLPNDSRSYMQLAQIYLFKKDTAQAIKCYEKGATVPQPDQMALQLLSEYRKRYGRK